MAYIIYPTVEDIINDMSSNSDICSDYFNKTKSIETIMNDFASLKILEKNRLSNDNNIPEIFLGWADEIFYHEKFTESLVNYIYDENSFDEINLKLCNSFRAYAEKHGNSIVDSYYVRIVINLLFRDIMLLDSLSDNVKKQIIKYLHIPIDRSVLMAIRPILNKNEFEHNLGFIPEDADESFIDSYIKYYTIQKFFCDLSLKIEVPQIYFYNLIKSKENLSGNMNPEPENKNNSQTTDSEDISKLYQMDEFLKSSIYEQYSENVHEIIKRLFGKLKKLEFVFGIINEKKYILINDFNNPEKNILKVWINNRSIHISVTKEDIQKYSSPDEIGETLINKIKEKITNSNLNI